MHIPFIVKRKPRDRGVVKKGFADAQKKRRKSKEKRKRPIKKAEQDKGEERKAQKRPVYGQQVTNA